MTPDILRSCLLTKDGLEIWIEKDRAQRLEEVLKQPTAPRFISIEGQFINTWEISGIFTPDAMEERQRRKNGQWKCMKGTWHDRSHSCSCVEHTETVTAFVEGVGEITYKR